MDLAAQYGYAIVSLVLYAVIAQVLNAATGIRKGSDNLAPGASHAEDYGNQAYRLDRTYMNTIEMGVIYVGVLVAAIFAGASPLWTNIFASVGLIARIAANVVYIRGIGAGYGGLRTKLIILASLCHLGLAILTVVAVL